jgi:hypothetical protein
MGWHHGLDVQCEAKLMSEIGGCNANHLVLEKTISKTG